MQQQLVAVARAHCPPSAAATSYSPAPGVKAEPAVAASPPPGPVFHGVTVGQSRRGGGGSSGDVSAGYSILSQGSSILSLSDLKQSSKQADQGVGSSKGEGDKGLHEGAAALPAPHVDLPALPQDSMHTFKVGVGLGLL